MCLEVSIVGWQAEMELEGATFVEEAGFPDELTQQLSARTEEDLQLQNSSQVFSAYTTCMNPCINTPTISLSSCVLEVEAASSNMTCLKKAEGGSKRKRSLKLSQQFMSLATIVPGIKEMDKTTVLEESISYLKHLQAKVKTLEEQYSKKKMVTTVVFVKKLRNHFEGESCPSDVNFTDETQVLPQIEARVSDRNVLIRIHCQSCKGVLVKAIEETEKLSLCVVSSSSIPFGNSTLAITILAQVNDELITTVMDLHMLEHLRSSLIQFTAKNLQQGQEKYM